ncbi:MULTISPECIES: CHC2 zinc finger domain-containing protein [Thermoanaerobacterium]|uniref:CHC2-family zinc finger protein n=2 Tax=Thermoanaerobacterium TaxID=28895 RepID=W9EHM9_9THEO|nr:MULTISPECIES: CHC2 zinc finger domain-containing protein [Thermoanaerobacterium]AFK86972.1 zinc finger, CHC2-family protein [Thermoanaerobacterium saccharolyticum JW/SL-YS485]ETO39219.1 CHC2-family zinc finger protein [Thermoanaerobacterium aotearoense SCUT27]
MTSNFIVADKFQEVKTSVTLLEAIERYGLNPIKKGSRYWALCPFHADKNPSMAIYDEAYHCYGCQAHGDVIDFTARYFNITPLEATKKLASDFGIRLEGSKPSKEAQRKIRQKQELDKLYKEYNKKFNEVYDYLCRLNQLYQKIKQAIETPEDMDIPEFVEACHMQDIVQYWLNVLLDGNIKEKIQVLKEVQEWKQRRK